jgi:hypothetical protein
VIITDKVDYWQLPKNDERERERERERESVETYDDQFHLK